MKSAAFILSILLVMAAALALRLPQLDKRPMHGDEGREAYTFGYLLETGEYRYNPLEFHGPTLPYFTLPVAWLQGKTTCASLTEWDVRIVPVLFGIALIALLLLAGDGLGRWAAVIAAILTALSPAMAFYSRYFIHEMLLVFFTFALIVFAWRYLRSGRLPWAMATGASLGLMHATKETCIIALIGMAGSLVLTFLFYRRQTGAVPSPVRVKAWHITIAVLLAAALSVLFFSSFFTYGRGPIDSILTYKSYLGRGSGEGTLAAIHVHPWHYYLQLLLFNRDGGLIWTEAFIVVLAAIGGLVAFLRPRPAVDEHPAFVQFLAFYTIAIFIAYSIIPYKTPWLILSALQPMILLAGFGAMAILRSIPTLPLKAIAAALLIAGTAQLGMQANRTCFRFAADRRNPYVYAHTVPDMLNLVARVQNIAQVHPRGRDMTICVISDYCWPLPWYLRDFPNVGYWQELPDLPPEAQPPLLIVSTELAPSLDTRLHSPYFQEFFGFRHNVHLMVYTRQDLWDKFIQTRLHPASSPR